MEKEKKLQILSDIIEMETVGDNEKDICDYFKKLFDEYDIPSEVVELDEGENRANFVAELEGDGEGKTLVYSGHLDVVSAGDVDDWKHDPFKLTEEDGIIYGRGVTDMKSGSAAIAIAMIELKESGESFNGKLRLILTSGEESEMPGSEKADERGDMKDADALVVAEPSNGAIITAHKGSFQYKITIKGKESHSSMPQLGINSIDIARKIMDGIAQASDGYVAEHEDDALDKTFNVFTRIDGGDQVNSVPAKTILYGNARTTNAFDNDKFLEIVEKVIKEVNDETKGEISIDVLENAIPVVRPKDSDLIKAIQKANETHDYDEAWAKAAKKYLEEKDIDVDIDKLQKAYEENPHPILTADGVTDASFLLKSNEKADFALFGPGIAPVAHQVDEFMFLEDYYAYCEKFVLIAKAYLND
ncbi:MAG: ArgE/DapE family deacylase [Aerococcus sp.]|nr:ArgE/DapE family deacylase [Aerococcus sp.]